MLGDLPLGVIPLGTIDDNAIEDLKHYWLVQCPTVSQWSVVDADHKNTVQCNK